MNHFYAFSQFVANNNVERTTRQTYSFLDLLGDVGGLTDSLYMLAEVILSSYFAFARSRIVLTALFRVKKHV